MSEQALLTTITIKDLNYKLTDANEPNGFVDFKCKIEVSYDSEYLGVDVWEAPESGEFPASPIQQLTLVGADQANLLATAILALLESYGETSILNDENLKEQYVQMVQETQKPEIEEAIEQSE